MKFIIKNKVLLSALIIFLVGLVLRFWGLDKFPVALNWDEASHGYNAYSILKTGSDEWGIRFPLIFRAFGDFKLPLYIYLTTLPVAIFGLNTFAVRFISALAGSLAILGIYFLSQALFSEEQKSKVGRANFGLFSAFLLAICPWHFFISRPALEANLSLTLIIFGVYFLILFLKQNASMIYAAIFFGLSLHTYNSARVFVPLFLLTLLLLNLKTHLKIKKNLSLFISLTILLASIFLVVFQVYQGEGAARYDKLKILSPTAVFQIGQARQQSKLPPIAAKLIHNQPVFFTTTLIKNYLSYFSPQFINQNWGAQFQFAIPQANLLTLPVYLLAIVGFVMALTKIKSHQNLQVIIIWLLLAPIPASLTSDPPQALRPLYMIPPLILLSTYGFSRLASFPKPKLKPFFIAAVLIWIVSSFINYQSRYYHTYATTYSSSWQYGYQAVVSFLKSHQSEYDRVFITKKYGEPHIFYAFYTQLEPRHLSPGPNNIRFEKSQWYWTDKIDNVYFVNDWQIPLTSVSNLPLESGATISTQRSLLVTSPDHVPVNAHVIQTINFLDGSPAFIITSVP